MKIKFVTHIQRLLLALSAMLLVSCGGTDPNLNLVLPADHIATCQMKRNWDMVTLGMNLKTVQAILGTQSDQNTSQNSQTLTYEGCRIFLVLVTKDDPTTPESELELAYEHVPGTVTLSGGFNGYVTAIASPKNVEDSVIHELTEQEKLYGFDLSRYCSSTTCEVVP